MDNSFSLPGETPSEGHFVQVNIVPFGQYSFKESYFSGGKNETQMNITYAIPQGSVIFDSFVVDTPFLD